ncbi:MAG: sulfatase-like hydrolase/transferase [Bacteroidota bacterium]
MPFLRTTAVFLLLFLSATLFAQEQTRPNIVWFVSEDNSPYLGAYGDSIVHTPHLDAFAREAILFRNAFANAPVCAPSRSAIITGRYPPAMGSQHMRSSVEVAEDIRFFPAYLREAGYYTTLRLKKDYNIPDQPGTWDVEKWWHLEDAFPERKAGQPFFMFYNTWMSHEGELHNFEKKQGRYFRSTFERMEEDSVQARLARVVRIDPNEVNLPAYLPDLPAVRQDMARYYEIMQLLDMEFHHFMQGLAVSGELDNTIIIYSSDHGGVLGRSKRFPLESGLHVPLMVRFPARHQALAPGAPGSALTTVTSFVDMAPTILALAGVKIPTGFAGKNFLAPAAAQKEEYAFGFRGRMDETYDMVRTLRDQRYRYVRNYNPHRPAGQRVNFLWQAPNLRAWEEAFHTGETTSVQAAFFQPRKAEELYDCWADPDNVKNLADDPIYQVTLRRMRKALQRQLAEINDTGFLPEAELFGQYEATGMTYQAYAATQPMKKIMRAAERATAGASERQLLRMLTDEIPAIRFWGATGCLVNKLDSPTAKTALKRALGDDNPSVRGVAAEALYLAGERGVVEDAMADLLKHENPYVVLRTANTLEHLRAFTPTIAQQIRQIAALDEKGRFDYAQRKCSYLKTLLP